MTVIKLELLKDALDTNGIGLNVPADAIGVLSKDIASDLKVIRKGKPVNLTAGDFLRKGDIVRTGADSQAVFFSSVHAVALSKVVLAPNAEFKLTPGSTLALEGELLEVAATEAFFPDLMAASAAEQSGLFGTAGLAGLPMGGLAAGGVALAALVGGGGSGGSADPGQGSESGSGGNGELNPGMPVPGPAPEPAPAPAAGPLSGGAAQLDDALGGALPVSFEAGASQLEALINPPLPVGASNDGGSLPLLGGEPVSNVSSLAAPSGFDLVKNNLTILQ